ncbi:AraC family transcriptional regulator [Nocardia takedensis]
MRFHSSDLDVIEDFMSKTFVRMRFDPDTSGASPTSWSRIQVGPSVSVDRFRFGCSMSYTAEPLSAWCVCSMRTGGIEHTDTEGQTTEITPGQVASLSPPDQPQTGIVRDTVYDIVWIDPDHLTRLTGTGRDDAPVRILGHRAGPTAAGLLGSVLDHVRDPATLTAIDTSPLLAHTLASHLTAVVAASFPLSTEPETGADRRDAHPDTVRRAIAYMETHVREPITITDIAAAAFVTPRAVQSAFRIHLDTTPLGYLRRLRMAGVHEQLRTATPTDQQTVTSIAHAWGIPHLGRFAIAYRREYGHSPHRTLRT